MEVLGIKCDHCGHIHQPDKPTYFTVMGNICIRKDGGIVGNNITQDAVGDTIVNSSHYCIECLMNILNEATGKPTLRERPF